MVERESEFLFCRQNVLGQEPEAVNGTRLGPVGRLAFRVPTAVVEIESDWFEFPDIIETDGDRLDIRLVPRI
jgi:hypothetical protein